MVHSIINKMTKYFSYFLVVASLFFISNLTAQPDSLFFKSKEAKKVIAPSWKMVKEVGLYLNQVSFTNWNAGGANSISAIATGKAAAKYKDEYLFWNSSVSLRYGINKQEDQSVQKTEDVIELISNLGFQKDSTSNWFYSAKFSFNSQFSYGYNYPDTSQPISKFMAPGYMFFGAGMEYGRHIDRLSFYASPLTVKTTFVLDDYLANIGAFGVDPAIYDEEGNLLKPGRKTRNELGILLTNQYEEELFENIKVNSLVRLYTDYINSFGNVDLEWELTFDMKVNKYVKAMLGSHLRYDNDVKTEVETDETTNQEYVISGPKLQWKQLLGVGVVVDLNSIGKS